MTSISPPVYNGRYELSRHIARGGMAEVYLAHDQLLDRPVALKVLFPELSVDRSFVERFRREAQAAANLSHPNIVSVYDWGEAEKTYFIVMEYVDGHPLSALIRAEGPLLPDRAAGIGAEVASALSFAHSHGVVHRDVKPGNVLLTSDGQVKVTDFGIARAANATENLTQTGAVMGTATYFSPEQAQGLAVDGRSDVYSLGVVLYEMVCGRPPFSADSPVTVAYKHVRESPPLPREVNPQLPEPFEAIILQAMAKDPAERYPSAQELRADLLRYQQGRAVMANPPATTLMAADATQVTERADHTETLPVAGKKQGVRTRTYVILLLVLLALLGVAVYLVGRNLGFFGNTAAAAVRVPGVVGQPLPQATSTLTRAGLKSKVVAHQANSAPANTVYAQSPNPPATLAKGSTVRLYVSTGPAQVSVPDVRNQPQGVAEANLRAAGFKYQVVTQSVRNASEGGLVIGQSPSPGTQVNAGSTVVLYVGSYSPPQTTTTTAPTTTAPPSTTSPSTSTTSTTSTTTTVPGPGSHAQGTRGHSAGGG